MSEYAYRSYNLTTEFHFLKQLERKETEIVINWANSKGASFVETPMASILFPFSHVGRKEKFVKPSISFLNPKVYIMHSHTGM